MAPEGIFAVGAGDGHERRLLCVLDPAAGALEISADLGLEIRKALMREMSRMKLRLYVGLLHLHVREFTFQIYGALIRERCKFRSYVLDMRCMGHGTSRALSWRQARFHEHARRCFIRQQ